MTSIGEKTAASQLPKIPMERKVFQLFVLAAFCSISAAAGTNPQHQPNTNPRELLDLSFEELFELSVTTVSRREEPVSEAPAAIHVITAEDIRRSGARTLPDILRLAPGVHVAQVNAHQWAVSARGFSDVFANKLLVMIDGRSLYTPLFSGVFWDSQHTLLEDIEQIEVIRGPGASLWGANAVNGVINIITKSARETQGTLITGAAGNIERFVGAIRHGGEFGENHFYRFHLQHREHTGFREGGLPGDDSWNLSQGGFRTDRYMENVSTFTAQGDFYYGTFGENYSGVQTPPPHDPVRVRGGNLLGRFSHSLESDGELTLQTYYDITRRDTALLNEERHTFDIDFQHQHPLADRHLLTWGAGYRLSVDNLDNTFDITFDPHSRTLQLFSLFVQSEIEVVEKRLIFSAGSKFEHHTFTDLEIQPNVRLTWKPHQRHTIWGAVSRAVRTPSRAERDIRINQQETPGQPPLVSTFGNPAFGSEELIAYEVGYRVRPHRFLTLDWAAFYNDYDRLRSLEPGAPRTDPPPAHLPVTAHNEIHGNTYGFEAAANWRASESWRLHGSYSFLQIDLRQSQQSVDPVTVEGIEGGSPKHQWLLHSSLDLPRDWSWDTWFRFTDRLPAYDIGRNFEMDIRLAWTPSPNLEIAFVGRNLIQSSHQEFPSSRLIRNEQTEVPRSLYAKVTWNL